MRIMFHGTTKENADEILTSGFEEGSCFASHLEDSFLMGNGPYVFAVFFEEDPFKEGKECWEYITSEKISPDNIIYLIKLSFDIIHYSKETEKRINKQFLTEIHGENTDQCDSCGGKGEIHDEPSYLPRLEEKERVRVVCPICKGFGSKGVYEIIIKQQTA